MPDGGFPGRSFETAAPGSSMRTIWQAFARMSVTQRRNRTILFRHATGCLAQLTANFPDDAPEPAETDQVARVPALLAHQIANSADYNCQPAVVLRIGSLQRTAPSLALRAVASASRIALRSDRNRRSSSSLSLAPAKCGSDNLTLSQAELSGTCKPVTGSTDIATSSDRSGHGLRTIPAVNRHDRTVVKTISPKKQSSLTQSFLPRAGCSAHPFAGRQGTRSVVLYRVPHQQSGNRLPAAADASEGRTPVRRPQTGAEGSDSRRISQNRCQVRMASPSSPKSTGVRQSGWLACADIASLCSWSLPQSPARNTSRTEMRSAIPGCNHSNPSCRSSRTSGFGPSCCGSCRAMLLHSRTYLSFRGPRLIVSDRCLSRPEPIPANCPEMRCPILFAPPGCWTVALHLRELISGASPFPRTLIMTTWSHPFGLNKIVVGLVCFSLAACDQPAPLESAREVPAGYWQAVITLPGGDIETGIEISRDGQVYQASLINGQERVRIDEVSFSADELLLRFPAFNNEIRARLADGRLIGRAHAGQTLRRYAR